VPAGLLNGVTAITATSGGGLNAATQDLGNLANAVAAVGGLGITFVASPKEAVKIAMLRGADFPFEVLSSGAITAGTVIAVAHDAIVSATGPGVRIEVTPEAVLHMEDASPAQIATGGAVAGTVLSLWQQDLIGMRLVFDASWMPRASGAVAFVQSVTW
jgi:hypothetical protein